MRGWALNAADFSPLTVLLVATIATIGALLIHWLSRRGKRPHPTLEDYAIATPAPDAMNAQGHTELRAAMLDVAARMGLPERLLPTVALPDGSDGNFVWCDHDGYAYCACERGAKIAEHRSTDLDDLLYAVFRDRAWMRTYTGLVGVALSPEDHAERLAAGQRELLAKASPAWAERLDRERSVASAAGVEPR